ncbi:MAG: GyrI-like domain-containing protein [Anaerolineae bacterium]
MDFVTGMMVAQGAPAPEGCLVRAVPGGTYARFDCTMATIGSTWGTIYGQWLPASGYTEDESRPAMEYYAPDAMGPEAPVVIYVAVKPKVLSRGSEV